MHVPLFPGFGTRGIRRKLLIIRPLCRCGVACVPVATHDEDAERKAVGVCRAGGALGRQAKPSPHSVGQPTPFLGEAARGLLSVPFSELSLIDRLCPSDRSVCADCSRFIEGAALAPGA